MLTIGFKRNLHELILTKGKDYNPLILSLCSLKLSGFRKGLHQGFPSEKAFRIQKVPLSPMFLPTQSPPFKSLKLETWRTLTQSTVRAEFSKERLWSFTELLLLKKNKILQSLHCNASRKTQYLNKPTDKSEEFKLLSLTARETWGLSLGTFILHVIS